MALSPWTDGGRNHRINAKASSPPTSIPAVCLLSRLLGVYPVQWKDARVCLRSLQARGRWRQTRESAKVKLNWAAACLRESCPVADALGVPFFSLSRVQSWNRRYNSCYSGHVAVYRRQASHPVHTYAPSRNVRVQYKLGWESKKMNGRTIRSKGIEPAPRPTKAFRTGYHSQTTMFIVRYQERNTRRHRTMSGP